MKFKLTTEVKEWFGIKLFRIEALIDIPSIGVKAGDKGGFVEKEENLSQCNDKAWVSDEAVVSDEARVSDEAVVSGKAWVSGKAVVLKPALTATRSDGYTFLLCKISDSSFRIIAGCRYFTFTEAREHWLNTRKDTQLGNESQAIVDYFERLSTFVDFGNSDEGRHEPL